MKALTLACFLGLSFLSSSSYAESMSPDRVRATHQYDPQNDRAVYGGYAYAVEKLRVGALTARTARAEDSEEARTLFARSLKENNGRAVFAADEGSISGFEVASSGKIAVRIVLDEKAEKIGTTGVLLQILDSSGRPVGSPIHDVQDFAWNPSGTQLAYCTGLPDDSRDDFQMTGTWLLDIESGKRTKAFEGGRHVAWANFDGNLYIYEAPTPTLREPRVWRYLVSSGALREAPYYGIDFSPSGNFYFRRKSPNYGRFDLFESRTNTSLLSSSKALAAFVPQVIGWLPDEDLLLFETWYYGENPRSPEEMPHSMLYDPHSDSVVDLGDVAIIGYDRTSRAIKWRSGHLEPQAVRDLIRGGTTVSPRVRR